MPPPPDVDDQAGLLPVAEGCQHGGGSDEDGGRAELLEEQLDHLGPLPQPLPVAGGRRSAAAAVAVPSLEVVPPVACVSAVNGKDRVDAGPLLLLPASAGAGGVLLPVPDPQRHEGIRPGRLVGVPAAHQVAVEVVVGVDPPAAPRPVENGDDVLGFFRPLKNAGGAVEGGAGAGPARQAPGGDDVLGAVIPPVAEAGAVVAKVADEGAGLVAAVHGWAGLAARRTAASLGDWARRCESASLSACERVSV